MKESLLVLMRLICSVLTITVGIPFAFTVFKYGNNKFMGWELSSILFGITVVIGLIMTWTIFFIWSDDFEKWLFPDKQKNTSIK